MYRRTKYILFLIGTLWFAPSVQAQTCTAAPSCAELGFTNAAATCVGGDMIKCPFDQSKVFCRHTQSCESLGFNKTTTQCTGKKMFACPSDAAKVACDDSNMVGEIKLWPSATIPKGWLKCEGQYLSTTTYSALYAVLGTNFGSSGSSFLLPDLRGRTVVGTGYNSGDNYNGYTYEFGKKGGNNYVVLDKTEVPDHQHLTDWGENNSGNRYGSYGSANQKGSGDTDWDNYQFRSGFMVDRYYTRANASSTSGSTTSSTSRYDDARTYAGSTGAHDNKMPFLVMNYIIYTGVY